MLRLLGIVLLVACDAVARADGVDLEGSWHVLVHYSDAGSNDPARLRWDDRIWIFEREGDRLRWREYPIVVFEDESGRFERRASGQYARVIGAWEPAPAQLENLRSGVRVDERGSKRKILRGSDADGWATARPRARTSGRTFSYSEAWSIEGLPERPVFTREESLGGVEEVDGLTRYETREVAPGGDLLRGSFDRDGTRRGRFRMLRVGPVRGPGERPGASAPGPAGP
jgi:hypothetical protein